jgi:hypothetical protein
MKGSFDSDSLDKAGLETYLKGAAYVWLELMPEQGMQPLFRDILAKVTLFVMPSLTLLSPTLNRRNAIIGTEGGSKIWSY